jgi:hypothetical protein
LDNFLVWASSSTSTSLGRSLQTSPALCHVVPAVSWFFSSSTTFFKPSFVRWYNVLEPNEPPPITTTSASLGIASGGLISSLYNNIRYYCN